MEIRTYKADDYTLTVTGTGDETTFRAVHHQGRFDLSDLYRPTRFNVPVAQVGGLRIVLNIIRHRYYVVEVSGAVPNFVQPIKTLDEAVAWSENYSPETPMEGRLPLKCLFADAKNGMELKRTYTFLHCKEPDTEFLPVCKVQTNGLSILRDGKPYWLDLQYSKRVAYNGRQLKLYAGCCRLLNEAEIHVLDAWEDRRDREAEQRDLLSDSNSQYYRKKDFFEQAGFGYLFSVESAGNLRFDQNRYMIIENNRPGCLLNSYDVLLK